MDANLFVKWFGWSATVLQGDVSMFDRWRWLRKHLSNSPCRTLDAGCGSGAYAMYAAKRGHPTTGLSWSDSDLYKARSRANLLKLRNIDYEQVDLRELDKWSDRLGQYDQIICFETIEHIMDDRKLMRNLAQLLQPGGRLLLTTPYKHYRRLRGDALSDHEDGGHVRWGYTHEELCSLFSENDLAVEAQEYISGWISQKQINFQRRIQERFNIFGISWLIIFPLRILWPLDNLLTRWLRYPYLSIGVVGCKRMTVCQSHVVSGPDREKAIPLQS